LVEVFTIKPMKFLTNLRVRPSGDGKSTAYVTIPRHVVDLWEKETGRALGNMIGRQVLVEVEVEL